MAVRTSQAAVLTLADPDSSPRVSQVSVLVLGKLGVPVRVSQAALLVLHRRHGRRVHAIIDTDV